MTYTDIIRDAFDLFRRQRGLWLFGILMALAGQGQYSVSLNLQSGSFDIEPSTTTVERFFPLLERILANLPLILLLGGMAFLLFALLWLLVGEIARGAQIGMVGRIVATGSATTGDGWSVGLARLRPMALLAILFRLPAFLLALPLILSAGLFLVRLLRVVGVPLNSASDRLLEGAVQFFLISLICVLPLFCLGVIAALVLDVLHRFAARACVLEEAGVRRSMRRGLAVARANLGYVLATWVLLTVTHFIFGFFAALPALVLALPLLGVLFGGGGPTLAVGSLLAVALYLTVANILVGGILTSFDTTLWTRLYQTLDAQAQEGPVPAVEGGA